MNLAVHNERQGRFRIEAVEDVATDDVLAALNAPGERLKTSAKSETKRVGDWVVKQSLRAFRRNRCRQAWRASIYLASRGVAVPAPLAYVEEKRFGLTLRSAVVTEYLAGFVTVEDHARAMTRTHAAPEAVHSFLHGLGQAVNGIETAKAWHADLSGKNIFTAGGEKFRFIDLDDVETERSCTRAERLKNHIQLYDSFCDLWGPEYLDPFISAMLPQHEPRATWIASVRRGQRVRRARIEAIWKRHMRE